MKRSCRILLSLLFALSLFGAAPPKEPKLVVAIVIDRSDDVFGAASPIPNERNEKA